MSNQPVTDQVVRDYEQRAEAAESSPVPVFLKIGRAIVWVVYALVLITALLLVLNFLLRLGGANADNSFVQWVYRSTDRAMEPFRGIFPTKQIDNSSSMLDFSVLFAALVYFVLAMLVDIGLRWLTQRLHRQQAQTHALRQQADAVARDAMSHEQQAQQVAREAAAREYAARQAAADQYAVARAAATEVVAQHVPPATPTSPIVPANPVGTPLSSTPPPPPPPSSSTEG